ncbi:MAG: phosphoserine transaminase [Alphaproteobacteria bacterium]|nr:phosphoserine transaminase [Alphaproteobacteria bacterium]OJV47611.1 MAG: phosphoserine aminotransferase [Alphaproteobacteria bacterium 43-37]
MTHKPTLKPARPFFSSGPCVKHPGWSLSALESAYVGRSHRSFDAKAKLKQVIELNSRLLGIPKDYKVGIVPGSDTGAVEMALWSLLGAGPTTVLAWDVFGKEWLKDATDQLKLNDLFFRVGDAGVLPDLSNIPLDHDIVFTWNGTTSGTCLENGDWISKDRTGLTICDAVSAIFAMELPWDKLDVVTYSWQKGLGGESAHGMIVLSPRAIERLKNYTPSWPVPKVFRLAEHGGIREGIFNGETINTPSLLSVEDCLDALNWAESIGGLPAMIKRSQTNFSCVRDWVASRTHWIDFMADKPAHRSTTSICLKLTDSSIMSLSREKQWRVIANITDRIAKEGAGYDIKGHIMDAPNIRIWCGPTVETECIMRLLPWIEWSYHMTLETIEKNEL